MRVGNAEGFVEFVDLMNKGIAEQCSVLMKDGCIVVDWLGE